MLWVVWIEYSENQVPITKRLGWSGCRKAVTEIGHTYLAGIRL